MDYKQVVEKKYRKYGRNCFRRWGSVENGGGNPVLIAQGEGRVRIIKRGK